MARAFANICFTTNVKQIQTKMGSRQNYQQFETGELETSQLTEFEKEFIEQRDSFYQATVSQTGWPYVQHRGGPAGFVKVIDANTIGYADFTGNRQYISVGNLNGDERISLIFMDYQQQRRLKIWGRARLIDESQEPNLIAQLEPVNSRAPIERGVVIQVEAYDWNCPKYITPRFTQQEVDALITRHASASVINKASHTYKGTGAIPMVITAIEQVTSKVRSYRLSHRDKKALPVVQAGAHITVPVELEDRSRTLRSYSLIDISTEANYYKIAVKLDDNGRGGSAAIHQHWQLGTELNIDKPENYFSLHTAEHPTILIAGGIGITAIMAMAQTLKARQQKFELHYTSSTAEDMAFKDQLLALYGQHCNFYFTREAQPTRLNLNKLIKAAADGSYFYICGPRALLQQAITIAEQLTPEQHHHINVESFQ